MEKDKIMTLSVNDIGAYFPYLHDLPSGFISLFHPLHGRVLCWQRVLMQTRTEMSDLAAFLQLMKDGMRFMKADIQMG